MGIVIGSYREIKGEGGGIRTIFLTLGLSYISGRTHTPVISGPGEPRVRLPFGTGASISECDAKKRPSCFLIARLSGCVTHNLVVIAMSQVIANVPRMEMERTKDRFVWTKEENKITPST